MLHTMGFDITLLWRGPQVNPINRKARSIPVFNVVDQHGRVFFFSWMGFMLGFWAWYDLLSRGPTTNPLMLVTVLLTTCPQVHIPTSLDSHDQKGPPPHFDASCQLQHSVLVRHLAVEIRRWSPLRSFRVPKSICLVADTWLPTHWSGPSCQERHGALHISVLHWYSWSYLCAMSSMVYRLLRQERRRHRQCTLRRLGQRRRWYSIFHHAGCIRLSRRGAGHACVPSLARHFHRAAHMSDCVQSRHVLPLP